MSEKLEELAARKQLLVARSALNRLQLLHTAQTAANTVRERLSWVHIGTQAATSAPVRSALFGLAISRLGHNRVAQLLSVASKIILFAKLTGVAVDIKRKLSHTSADVSERAGSAE